jgi:hypothetical protein
MEDQHHETNPAMGNDISADIPDILESIKFHWDVFGSFCGTLSTTSATGIFPGTWGRTSKTASYTLTDSDYWLDIDTSGGDVTLTLPAASSAGAGRYYFIKVNDATNECLIDGNASETIDGETIVVLTQVDEVIGIICDGSNWNVLFHYAPTAASGKAPPLPRSYIAGLTMSNDTDTDHDINITAGECRDSTNTYNIVLESEITKKIDATWAAGDDGGGMNDGEAVGNDTWYHVHLLFSPTTGVVDVGFDTSLTAANLLADTAAVAAGHTKYRRLGSVLTDGTANILGFSQFGDEFLWDDPPLDINITNLGTSVALQTLSVPPDVQVHALITAMANTAEAYAIYLSCPDQNDEAPSGSLGTAPLFTVGGTANVAANLEIRTNTAKQINARSTNINTDMDIVTRGYKDSRGRYS